MRARLQNLIRSISAIGFAMTMVAVLSIGVLSGGAFARAQRTAHTTQSARVTNVIEIANHGGQPLSVNVGANLGDIITLDVACDYAVLGECFAVTPKLADGALFTLPPGKDLPNHQTWQLASPTTGNQIISAQYWAVGWNIHYRILIVATEKLSKE